MNTIPYRGYTIERVDNFTFYIKGGGALGFTTLAYAKEHIDTLIADLDRIYPESYQAVGALLERGFGACTYSALPHPKKPGAVKVEYLMAGMFPASYAAGRLNRAAGALEANGYTVKRHADHLSVTYPGPRSR